MPVGDACYTGGAGLLLMWKENAPACAWGGMLGGENLLLVYGCGGVELGGVCCEDLPRAAESVTVTQPEGRQDLRTACAAVCVWPWVGVPSCPGRRRMGLDGAKGRLDRDGIRGGATARSGEGEARATSVPLFLLTPWERRTAGASDAAEPSPHRTRPQARIELAFMLSTGASCAPLWWVWLQILRRQAWQWPLISGPLRTAIASSAASGGASGGGRGHLLVPEVGQEPAEDRVVRALHWPPRPRRHRGRPRSSKKSITTHRLLRAVQNM